MRQISFLVVDDHPVFRQGIVALVQSDPRYHVSAEAGSMDEALDAMRHVEADIALVDISLYDKSGLDFIRMLHIERPQVPVLIISMHDELVYTSRALKAGARGYVMKHEDASVIREAIATVLAGHVYVSEKMRHHLLDNMYGQPSDETDSPIDRLSDREFEVFKLFGLGYGAKEISQVMNVSTKTVSAYRDRLRQKLNVSTAAELRKLAATWMIDRSR